MKVGLISFHAFNNPGGVKSHILGLSAEFQKRGVESKIIVPRPLRKRVFLENVMQVGTSISVPFGGAKGDLCINFNPIAIEKILSREKFDVLHFHNFGLPSALQILLSPSTAKCLNVMTFHSSMDGSRIYRNMPELFYPVKKIVKWKIDGIIGVAPFILNDYFNDYHGPKEYIPNGVDLDMFNPDVSPAKKYAKDKSVKILFLSRLDKRKGLIFLLKAYKILCKKYDNLSLIVVGDGPERKKCEEYIKKNDLKKVQFKGVLKEKIAPNLYKSCDIYCSPAFAGESFGIVLIEAMAVGKPVVAFANKGYKTILDKKESARFLARPGSFADLAQKMELLIKDKNLRKKMGEWGSNEAKKYAWPKIGGDILEFYEKCRIYKMKRESADSGY